MDRINYFIIRSNTQFDIFYNIIKTLQDRKEKYVLLVNKAFRKDKYFSFIKLKSVVYHKIDAETREYIDKNFSSNDVLFSLYDKYHNNENCIHRYSMNKAEKRGLYRVVLQHGLFQKNLNYGEIHKYCADLVCIWDQKTKEKFYNDDDYYVVTGTTKIAISSKFLITILKIFYKTKKFKKVVLICDSVLPHEYDKNYYYNLLNNWIKKYPNYLFIFRPHRGVHRDMVTSLRDQNNFILSKSKRLWRRIIGFYNILKIADIVITPPSTVILDSVINNVNFCVYNSDLEHFDLNVKYSYRTLDEAEDVLSKLDIITSDDLVKLNMRSKYNLDNDVSLNILDLVDRALDKREFKSKESSNLKSITH